MNVTLASIRAVALVDDENGISLSHLFPESKRAEWQEDIDLLTAKLAQKGATHTLRMVDVTVMPTDVVAGMLVALKALCDHEASYHGNEIRIACDDHGDAIKRMRIARAAIAKAEGR